MPRRLITGTVLALAALAAIPPAAGAARTTGRYLVVFKHPAAARSASTVSAVLARAGARRAGGGVPRVGVARVRGSAQAITALRRDRAVTSVSPEYLRRLRRVPNDPALSTRETQYGGVPGGGPIQWALARQRFPGAWDLTTGAGAVVGVIDSGLDVAHPELGGKVNSLDAAGASNPGSDPEGHGTHVSGLACAATNNGIGVAGAGWDCRLAFVKVPSPDIPDQSVIDGIVIATNRGALAINMSFGGGPPSPAVDTAIQYAVQHGVVLVASASNDAETDQGAPASQLQPGDAPNIGAGRGLVVTAADFSDRRPGTGFGPQVSLAAYGFFARDTGPPGLISTFPGNHDTDRDLDCQVPGFICVRRNLGGDDRYAYLQGTSMAAPQVAAVAAMVAKLNPFLGLSEKMRLIKQTARRSGGWTSDLGWGILDAQGAVDTARRVDHVAPGSRVRKRRRRVRVRRHRKRAKVRLRWRGSDPAGAPGLVPSGLQSFDLYMRRGHRRYRRIRRRTHKRSARMRLRPGRYRFYTRARDRAGNLEAKPRRADLRLRVKKPRRRRLR
jgi:serine protease